MNINNSDVYGIDSNVTYNVVKMQKLNGLWSVCGMSDDNGAFIDLVSGVNFRWPTRISTAVAYSPIERISIGSYTKCLAENTTIKIYGFY